MTTSKKMYPPPASLIEQMKQALASQQAGQMDDAEKSYKKALADHPDVPDVQHMAGLFFAQIGKRKYAITLFRKILAQKMNDANLQKVLGIALYDEEQYEEALQHLKISVKLNQNDPEALRMLGYTYHRMKKLNEASVCYKKALEIQDNLTIRNKLAEILLIQQKYEEVKTLLEEKAKQGDCSYDTMILLAYAYGEGFYETAKYLVSAILTNPEKSIAKSMFTNLCYASGIPSVVDENMRTVTRLCLEEKEASPFKLKQLWFRQVFENKKNEAAYDLIKIENYSDFASFFSKPENRAPLFDPLFQAGIKKTGAFMWEIERLCLYLRRFYLNEVFEKKPQGAKDMELLAALAGQAEHDEYVSYIDKQDSEILHALKEELKNCVEINRAILIILTCACYAPAKTFVFASDIETALKKNSYIKTILFDQAEEDKTLENLKKSIKSLSPIKDAVSKKVQDQYEENPYPRWKHASLVRYPGLDFIAPAYRGTRSALIAGCGTGQHICATVSNYMHTQILAIDISLTSLAYAKMKCAEYAIHDVEFLHADILDLHKLKRSFDVIECAGVLHHMHDPEAGLRALVNLMKPNATIKLGLYSEIARRDIVEARRVIEEKKFPPTEDGIRTCREYLRTNEFNVANRGDFFTMSNCRDLIFHVQEHRFTWLQVGDMLKRCGLEIMSVTQPKKVMDLYKEKFPDDPKCINLSYWHQYELENPNTFGGMFEFTSKKA